MKVSNFFQYWCAKFNHTNVTCDRCVTEPHLPLCLWAEFLQLGGVGLPWKQKEGFTVTAGKPRLEVYLDGSYASKEQEILWHTMMGTGPVSEKHV